MNLKLIASVFTGTISVGGGLTAYALINSKKTPKSRFPNLRVLKKIDKDAEVGIWEPKIELLKNKLKSWNDGSTKKLFFDSMVKYGIEEKIIQENFNLSFESVKKTLVEAKALSTYCNNFWISENEEEKNIEDIVKELCSE